MGRRCVTLLGPGGVGKSRLAIEVARALSDRFAGAVSFCDLTAIEEPESLMGVVAGAIGSPLTAPLEREHVIADASRVASRLLDAAPKLVIISTTRQPLHIRREHIVTVAPLSPPSAVRLYQLRAAAAGASADDPAAITELCRRLDNLPLAIEIAAAWSRSLTAGELVARVCAGGHPPAQAVHDVPSRHRTLDATIAWSYDLLADDERRLLERLSVLAGPFDLDTAAIVAAPEAGSDEAGRRLVSLIDRSLVVVERRSGQSRYRLLETTRASAMAHLRRRGDYDDAVARHAEWAACHAEEIAVGFHGPDAQRWAQRAEDVLPEFRASVFRSLERGSIEPALRVVGALAPLVYEWLRADIAAWATRSVDVARAARHDIPPPALVCAALGPLQAGNLAGAQATLAEVAGAWPAIVRSDTGLYSGDYDKCAREAELAIEAGRVEGNDVVTTLGLFNLALAHAYRGDIERALATAATARKVADITQAPSALAWVDFLDGELLLDSSPQRAQPLLERALHRARMIRSALTEGIALVSLTTLQARHGEPVQAVPAFEDAIRHWQQRDDWTHQRVTLRNLVLLLERVGADDAAALLLGALEHDRPSEPDEYSAVSRGLQERIGDRFTALTARGQTLDRPDVIDMALHTLAALAPDTPP